ncbi:hypothetical protein LTR62_001583 [Meristemomyces frigidus]|uniref:Uncharacterized protein n=1 Tax=Meristemomyces frigidus TaxID=1508187 RepID=A0AAN7T981_9PEZI|nr:hypothetical protein LTR62_001583 [Meristemomyces frigidus]
MNTTSPSKELTPSSDASTAKPPGPHFTEKEERVMRVAWSCLKSGPPEIDMAKLQRVAGFNTVKTTANTWGTIKKKLAQLAPPTNDDGGEGSNVTAPSTPKTPKAKTTPKKRAAKTDGDDDEVADNESPKKRKTPAKKTPKKADTPVEALQKAVEETGSGDETKFKTEEDIDEAVPDFLYG